MLGYVVPDKGELKVREYEVYTGYYCGICKYISRTYGQLPRMVLSYDAAFIALLLASVDPAPDAPSQEHCAVHHIKHKTIIRNRAIEYAGDLMLILAWFKLQDDAQDEGRFSAKAGLAAFRPTWKKLQARHPNLCRKIDEELSALNALERARCPSIDRVAEGFARVMDAIFRDGAATLYGAPGSAEPKVKTTDTGGAGSTEPVRSSAHGEAHGDPTRGNAPTESEAEGIGAPTGNSLTLHETFAKLGYHLGKWIYLIDAADDIEENLETGAYNPLIYRFRYGEGSAADSATGTESVAGSPGTAANAAPAAGDAAAHAPSTDDSDTAAQPLEAETPEAFRARIDQPLRFNLFQYLAVISETLEDLEIRKNSGIIENVIYLGLNRRTEEVLQRITPKRRTHEPL